MYKIIGIMGQAGSGKDTLLKEIINQNSDFHEIVSYTTRPPREGEVDGVNYHFITKEEFLEELFDDKLFESAYFREWYYGTSVNSLDKNKINIGVFNPCGISQLLEKSQVKLYLVYVIADNKIRLLRQLNREEHPDTDEIVRRYLTDQEDFKTRSAEFFPQCEWIVIDNNGDVPIADQAKIVIERATQYLDTLK